MRIRIASIEDAPGIASLSSQLGYPAEPDEVAGFQTSILQHNDHCIFVSQDEDGTINGWLHIFLSWRLFLPPFVELGGIVVDEACRESGIGHALLARAEEWTIQSGCTIVRIRSDIRRVSAHKFYERMGYTVSKSQQVFEKSLSNSQHA